MMQWNLALLHQILEKLHSITGIFPRTWSKFQNSNIEKTSEKKYFWEHSWMAASQRQQQRYIHFKSCNGYIHFYIPFFYIFPPHIHLKNVLIPFPSRLHLQQTFIPPPKVNSSQLNNNFHIRTPPKTSFLAVVIASVPFLF